MGLQSRGILPQPRTQQGLIEYARLTWPEVEALDRSLPVYLPLGDARPPGDGILLPAVPYGFELPGWQACQDNLAAALQEEGFGPLQTLPGRELTWSVDPGRVLLIPVGHTEQHGPHLSLAVDTLLVDALARGIENADRLPTMPYGVSTHRACFGGTLNLSGRAFEDFYLELLEQLYARGHRTFYLLSGHGGNCSFLVSIVKYFGERHPDTFCATSFLYLSGAPGAASLERHRSSPRGGMGHAGELETSLMLHLAPEQVFMERVVDELDFIATDNYFMDWIEGGALVANPSWYDDTATGSYGAGSHATAEKGRLWLADAIAEKEGHVREIEEQHRRRQERRARGYGRWGKS